jgi:protein involved in polysaccharide export with SLBB domain
MIRSFTSWLVLAVGFSTVINTAPVLAQTDSPVPATPPTVSDVPGAVGLRDVPDNYRLDTDDTILIDVARHTDVSRSVRIPADGTIRLPRLLSPVQARGKTSAELSDLITEKLVSEGKLVLRPGQVTVAVTGLRLRRVFIRGSAVGGKIYDLKNDDHISEVIAAVGGVTQPERLTAVITGPQRSAPVTVNLDAALNTPGSPDNIALLEGDTLTIDAPRKIRFFVEGEGPRGMKEFDQRYGLKQILVEMGFTANGATGDLHKARIRRKVDPLDPASADTYLPVDLLRVMSEDSFDVKIQDMDTLQIPVSEQFIYVFGEVGGARKVFLPQDRTWYLSDVIANAGGTSPQAKIGSINIIRNVEGKPLAKTYDFGKFLGKRDVAQNPEVQAGDLVYVPNVKRPDVGSIWTTFGLFNLVRSIFPVIPGAF